MDDTKRYEIAGGAHWVELRQKQSWKQRREARAAATVDGDVVWELYQFEVVAQLLVAWSLDLPATREGLDSPDLDARIGDEIAARAIEVIAGTQVEQATKSEGEEAA